MNSTYLLVGQAIGFAAMGIAFLLPWQRKRSAYLVLKLICDFLWIFHNGMIGALSGMAISVAGVLREILFIKIPKEKRNVKLLIGMVLVGWISVLLVRRDAWSLVSMLSFTLSCIASWSATPNRIRLFTFLTSCSQLCYGIHVGSIAGIMNETLSISSVIIYLIGAKIAEIKKKKNRD